jgi:hypothetical protein
MVIGMPGRGRHDGGYNRGNNGGYGYRGRHHTKVVTYDDDDDVGDDDNSGGDDDGGYTSTDHGSDDYDNGYTHDYVSG